MESSSESAYAQALKEAMRGFPEGPLTIRELERRLGYSYEHLRKVLSGAPLVSRLLNRELCQLLSLDETKMWRLARIEKARKRFKEDALEHVAVLGEDQMLAVWMRLSSADRLRVIEFMEALAKVSSLQRAVERRGEVVEPSIEYAGGLPVRGRRHRPS